MNDSNLQNEDLSLQDIKKEIINYIKQYFEGEEAESLIQEIKQAIKAGIEEADSDGQISHRPVKNDLEEIEIYINVLETYFLHLPMCIQSVALNFNEENIQVEIENLIDADNNLLLEIDSTEYLETQSSNFVKLRQVFESIRKGES